MMIISISTSSWQPNISHLAFLANWPTCPQEEPTVITLDNVADYLHRPGARDVFDVNVQAVIKTRDSPNSNKQFYLDV